MFGLQGKAGEKPSLLILSTMTISWALSGFCNDIGNLIQDETLEGMPEWFS